MDRQKIHYLGNYGFWSVLKMVLVVSRVSGVIFNAATTLSPLHYITLRISYTTSPSSFFQQLNIYL